MRVVGPLSMVAPLLAQQATVPAGGRATTAGESQTRMPRPASRQLREPGDGVRYGLEKGD
jgi:hypothetical protein